MMSIDDLTIQDEANIIYYQSYAKEHEMSLEALLLYLLLKVKSEEQ